MEESGQDRDREWRQLAERLPREVQPPRDLWQPIETRIREESRPWTSARLLAARPLLAAAAVALVMAGGYAAVRFGGRRPEAKVAVVQLGPGPHVAVAPTEDEWAAASDHVLRTLDEAPNLDPKTREVVRQNLAIIDEAVRKIHKALEDDPQSPYLQHLLTAEYQRRSALLRKVASGAM